MTVREYMIPVYGLLIKTQKRTIEDIPEVYKIPAAEYLEIQEKEKI
ncbi:hypothetical protein KQI88_10065 [Alkaliphilus sp. MSJ-5]|uniref:XkdX family protein n=1 Tax=Alkaliphilus flagellatus TaxID=2841507 RepID=A0ABS6G2S1_9FIRM|nr:CD1375 family protein [Alkaliphilus flagellatus]MBU5676764.1 hypothetical protein [Alkaliphilus flagellatus]